MPVLICMLRGVNVGGHHTITMDTLRELCAKLQLCDVQTHLQSGNVVFRTEGRRAEDFLVGMSSGRRV